MTLTLRARLAAISTIVFGLLLAALSFVSYTVLSRRLDADVTERLTELTDGLHGYLRFDGDTTSDKEVVARVFGSPFASTSACPAPRSYW